MKTCFVAIALAGVFACAQDQSSCPGRRQLQPTSNCDGSDVKRDISVHVVAFSTGKGGPYDGYFSSGPNGYITFTDVLENVEKSQYRACDVGAEIIQRVKESLQRIGYFCAEVEHVVAQKIGKKEYRVSIRVAPGEQYRLGEVHFTGATVLSPDELRSELRMKPDAVFNTESVRRGLKNIEKSYDKKGHPNVTANLIASVNEKNKTVSLDIRIKEAGPPN